MPLLMLAVARYIPASPEMKQVLIVQAAMPAAVFPIVLARRYGGDPITAIRIVIGTSLVGFITIPLWLRLGMRFVPH
jgi:predicted permease